LFQTFLQGLRAPTLAPPPWAIEEGQRRLVLLLNHILLQEPEALARLARQKGQVVHVQWHSVALALIATPAGLLDLAPVDAQPDLHLSLTEPSAWTLMQQVMRGDKPQVRVEGNVQLAAEVNWLADHVRWDIEAEHEGLYPAQIVVSAINEPGTLGSIANLIGETGANIDHVQFANKSPDVRDIVLDLEVRDLKHLTGILSQLKASSVVSKVERVNG
jgi:ubiquinone biosynthesis protein UbiJ